jgi:hypothetical protein
MTKLRAITIGALKSAVVFSVGIVGGALLVNLLLRHQPETEAEEGADSFLALIGCLLAGCATLVGYWALKFRHHLSNRAAGS